MSTNPIDAFLDKRPYYEREHVESIEEYARQESIPFCTTCADWHLPDEGHTHDD